MEEWISESFGPCVMSLRRWIAPVAKYSERATGMARSTMSPAAVVRHVTRHATLARFVVHEHDRRPHQDLDDAENFIAKRTLRFPYRALPLGAAQQLREVGFVRVRPFRALAEASLARSALRHWGDAMQSLAALWQACEEGGSLASMARPELARDRTIWTAPAHADELHAALIEARAAMSIVPPPEWYASRRSNKSLLGIFVLRVRWWFSTCKADDDALTMKCAEAMRPLGR